MSYGYGLGAPDGQILDPTPFVTDPATLPRLVPRFVPQVPKLAPVTTVAEAPKWPFLAALAALVLVGSR